MLKYLFFFAAIKCITCPSPAIGILLANTVPTKAIEQEQVPIVNQDSHVDNEKGTFDWSYETADGTKVEQSGEFDPLETEKVKSLVGSYSYQDPEGKTHEVHYVANEHGFQPTGDDIAPEIVRNIEFLASQPESIGTEHTS